MKDDYYKLFITLERNSINVYLNTLPQLALQKWEPAGHIG